MVCWYVAGVILVCLGVIMVYPVLYCLWFTMGSAFSRVNSVKSGFFLLGVGILCIQNDVWTRRNNM